MNPRPERPVSQGTVAAPYEQAELKLGFVSASLGLRVAVLA